jgi:hypothetical protein
MDQVVNVSVRKPPSKLNIKKRAKEHIRHPAEIQNYCTVPKTKGWRWFKAIWN